MLALPDEHQPHVYDADDAVFLLRGDEAAAGNGMVDAKGGANFTDVASVGVAGGLFGAGVATGARTFNGTTQWQTRASTGTERTRMSSDSLYVGAWVKFDVVNAYQCLVALGDQANPTHMLFSLSLNNTGSLYYRWENTAGVVTGTASNFVAVAGVAYHVALVRSPPLSRKPDTCDVSIYVGDSSDRTHSRVFVARDVGLPDGGVNASWSIGAHYSTGGGVNRDALDGTLDDVLVANFAASEQFARAMFARGVRDFSVGEVVDSDFYTTYGRVLIGDVDNEGDIVDFSTALGTDWIQSYSWDESADKQSQTARIEMARNIYSATIAPLMSSNAVSNAKLLARVVIETAVVPLGMPRSAAAIYMEPRFDGFLTGVDTGKPIAVLECMDQMAALLDAWVEPDAETGTEQTHGSIGGLAIETVIQNILDENDPGILPILSVDDSGAGNRFVFTTYDTTTGAGRVHGLKVGDTVHVEGTTNYNGTDTVYAVTATTFTFTTTTGGGLAAETLVYGAATVSGRGYKNGIQTLYTPATPVGWNVLRYLLPSTKNVGQAVDDPPSQIGWVCQYRYDDNRKAFRLTLRAPDRAGSPLDTFSMRTFFTEVSRLELRRDDIRNIVVVEVNRADLADNLGRYIRRTAVAFDANSIALYGRRYCRIGVASTSRLNTLTEGQTLANNVLSDLALPLATLEGKRPYRPDFQLDDLITLSENDVHFDAALDFSAVSLRYSFTATTAQMAMTMRGAAPVGRIDRHLDMEQASGFLGGDGLAAPSTPPAPTVTAEAGRLIVTFAPPVNNLSHSWDVTEFHIGATGFTPSATSLVVAARSNYMPLSSASGVTVYVKLIHRDVMGNSSAASAQTAGTPL